MDPLSVTAACVGLLNGILGLSKQISSFVIGTRDAHKDMQAFSKELVSLQLCLESPKEERIVNQFPDRLKQSLLVIIRSCSDIVEQMSGLLERHSSVNLGRRMQWSMFSRDEAEKLRNNLEAHKSAIEIASGVSALTLGSDIKEDTEVIRAETSYLPEIKQDTSQISELRTEIQALRFQIMQIGQPQTAVDERLSNFLDESIAYTESIVEAQSTLEIDPPLGPGTLHNVALTQTTTSSSDTKSILSNHFSSTRSSNVAPSIYSTSTSLSEFWEPLVSVTTTHPKAIPLDRHGIEASHRTRKRFPKWKKEELDQLLADAIAYQGSDRQCSEQVNRCKSLLNLGAKIQHSIDYLEQMSAYGTLAPVLYFGGRPDLISFLLSRGARINAPDHFVRNACLSQHLTANIELLHNQGCDINALIRGTVTALNLPGRQLLVSKGSASSVPIALKDCLLKGWISGMEYLARVSTKVTSRPQALHGTATKTILFMYDSAEFNYTPELSIAFVARYEEIKSSDPTLECEIQLRQNYLDEVRRQFADLAPPPGYVQGQEKTPNRTSSPPQQQQQTTNAMMLFGRDDKERKEKKNLKKKREKEAKTLTGELHLHRMLVAAWDARNNRPGRYSDE